jgi:hypothetical protein
MHENVHDCKHEKGRKGGKGGLAGPHHQQHLGNPKGGRTLYFLSQHPLAGCALNIVSYRPPGFIPVLVWPASPGFPFCMSGGLCFTSFATSLRNASRVGVVETTTPPYVSSLRLLLHGRSTAGPSAQLGKGLLPLPSLQA